MNVHHRSRQNSRHEFSSFLPSLGLELLFRVGFAGVFLVNAALALLEPASFAALMRDSFLGAFLSSSLTPWLWLIAVNDALLGALILSGRWRGAVLAWSGAWLFAVTLLKVSSLLTNP
jgi:hypothetical protein